MKPYSCDHCGTGLADMERARDKNSAFVFGTCCVACAKKMRVRKHYRENKGYYATKSTKRRAGRLGASPPWYGEFDALVISEAYTLCAMRRYHTGIDWHVDHMIPLRSKSASGLHCADNIQVIPAVMNSTKGNRMTLTNRNEWISVIKNCAG